MSRRRPTVLKADTALEQSPVVANCLMNRERELAGANGYGRDVGIDIAAHLRKRLADGREARWLDLCCGRGRALAEAARLFERWGRTGALRLHGVDLVGMFDETPKAWSWLLLEETPARLFEPPHDYHLITCVHGLHYIGDKLALISRATSWLADDGLFVANLDLANFALTDGDARRRIPRWLRSSGASYDARRRLVSCRGRRVLEVPWDYLGADDDAGPNYTGQRAVNSVYGPAINRGAPL